MPREKGPILSPGFVRAALRQNEGSLAILSPGYDNGKSRRVATVDTNGEYLHFVALHAVFSTKNRQPFLVDATRERLFSYLGGIARENGMKALEIGGVADHVHLLLSIPASLAVSKAVQLIKGASSHWLKTTFANMIDFAWQDGYAAFTVSQ